jgi:hypothetical protein
MTSSVAAWLVRLERNTGSCRPRVAVIERGDHDRARQFLQDNGVDLARVMFVVTGVLRGQPEHEKQAGWLRAAKML